MKNIVVVYHTRTPSLPCPDGFACAALFWSKFGEDADCLPAMYHKELPLTVFEGREVYFADFSFSDALMEAIAAVAKFLLVFDHHPRNRPARPYEVLSNSLSGCLLVWQYLHGTREVPKLLAMIDAEDTARTAPQLDAFMAALNVEELSFKRWNELLATLEYDTRYAEFLQRGSVFKMYDNTRVESLVKDAFTITIGGVNGLAVNADKFFAHAVAMRLAQTSGTFGAVFFFRTDGCVEVSLRSPAGGSDVRSLAQSFGGGGHVNAAAFSVSIDKFRELVHVETKLELYARIETALRMFPASAMLYVDIAAYLTEENLDQQNYQGDYPQ